MNLTREEAQSIIYEDHEDFKVIEDKIVDTSRWSEQHDVIVKQLSTGKFFASYYAQGLTERQDESPYENDDPEFWEVFPKEITVIHYVEKEEL